MKKFVAAAAAVGLLLAPMAAQATGEAYSWHGVARQQIDATGGDLGSGATSFTAAPSAGGDHTYKATVTCADSSSAQSTITVSQSDYQANDTPTPATASSDCAGAGTASIKIYKSLNAAQAQAIADESNGPSCKGGVLSYVLCPIYNFILSSVQFVEQKVIVPFLQITPIPVGQPNNQTYQVWQQFRNLANVGFIIAFLIMIFATTLSIQLDSYSLKKMLPRLVMAAVLVQFSYLIVALAVDVTNVIGAGLQALVLAPLNGHTTILINNVVGGIGIAAGVAGAVAVAGGVITGSILVILIAAFFAIIGVFLTLVARQILVMLLLILGPLAFVAWILPNTEHLFKYWYTTLIRLLMMYPMIVMLFAAGKLFSTAAATGALTNAGNDTLRSLISVVAGVIPLFFIPLTFKYAGSALTTVNGWITTATKGGRSKVESSAGYERMKKRTEQRRTELAAGQKVRFLGADVGGSRTSAIIGRGAGSLVTSASKKSRNAADVRAMVEFNKNANDWKKRLEDENMTYEGFTYLSLGDTWYDKTYGETQDKYNDAVRTGDSTSAAIHAASLDRMVRGKAEAGRYMNISEARAAAGLLRSGFDLAGPEDREALLQYTADNDASRFVQRQMWGRIKEGSRKVNVHLAYTDVDGNIDAVELRKNVAKKSSGDWVNYSKDAIEAMAKNNVLSELARDRVTRQVLINTLSHVGGPSIGAEQQKIIIEELKKNPYGGPATDIKDDIT